MLSKRFKNDGIAELKLNAVQSAAKKEVEEKIEGKIYSFESINCVICGSHNAEVLSEKDRYGLDCNTLICKDCGFAYTSPRMTEDSYAKFYDSEYRRLYVGTEKPGDVFFNDQKFRGEKIYRYIGSKINLNSRKIKVLEVGCGAGGILEVFRAAGHEVFGLDLGDEYLTYGKDKFGLNLKKGVINDLPNDFKADIIIYSHVLEHILDLNRELGFIKEKLADNGLVYIEVPGLKFIHSTYEMNFLKYLQNAHTFHFTKNSLSALFTNNGFSCLQADEQVRSLFAIENINEPKVGRINEYLEIIAYLRKNEKFRFLNFLRFKKLKWKIKNILIKILKKN